MKTKRKKKEVKKEVKLLKLDIGCGKHKQPDHVGIDVIPFEGVDIVLNAGEKKLPFKDGTVDHIHTSHFVEHLTAKQRIHFVNEAHRVLKEGGTLYIATPHWASCRAYGDLTHMWPPVSEFWYFYLDADWRKDNAPHNDFYTCDFTPSWGYAIKPEIEARSEEQKTFAVQYYKEAIMDMHATLTKKPKSKK